jgi:hypothetical protein
VIPALNRDGDVLGPRAAAVWLIAGAESLLVAFDTTTPDASWRKLRWNRTRLAGEPHNPI